jgi:PhzF family phenazine biosynthesis protein
MVLKFWQIDAFAAKPLEGNPAGVVPLEHWPDDGVMQKIAEENNLSETAFFAKTAPGRYDLRWFTPTTEVDLCGHATLASAWVIFDRLEPAERDVRFQTRSGELTVTRGSAGRLVMSLPTAESRALHPPEGFAQRLAESLRSEAPLELRFADKGGAGFGALLAVWPDPAAIEALQPDGRLKDVALSVNARSVIATAPGYGPYDFISRFFAPAKGVPEDPVTGSAHCALTPYWSRRLGRKILKARQVSARGGDILCTDEGTRILLEGSCALYLTGEIAI